MNKIEEPLQLAHIACPNRVIRSAVHSFLGTTDGHMTDAEYDMYAELAANRVGTIISGHCAVSPIGRANPEQINIFVSKQDINRLRIRAMEEGIPYQVLASGIIHKYLDGRLSESL